MYYACVTRLDFISRFFIANASAMAEGICIYFSALFAAAIFKGFQVHLIADKTINNVLFESMQACLQQPSFINETRGQSVEQFSISIRRIFTISELVLRFSLSVCCSFVCVLFIVEAKQCLRRYPIPHDQPIRFSSVFFLVTSLITRAFSLVSRNLWFSRYSWHK